MPLKERIFKNNYVSEGTWTMRAGNQMMAGFDYAILDLIGQLDNRPVHRILGGAHRDQVGYFFFFAGEHHGRTGATRRRRCRCR